MPNADGNEQLLYIVGIDPGTDKCGMALLDYHGNFVQRVVVSTDEWTQILTQWAQNYNIKVLVLGDRTGAAKFRRQLESMLLHVVYLTGAQITMVDEHLSSVQGRRLYLLDHRRGWQRFIPLGLRYPAEPYDDYVAEVLARRYLKSIGKA